MAAPIGKQLTFCKLSNFHRIFGIGSVRTIRSLKREYKDRTPEQQYKNDPARIDETPGPWKSYTNLKAYRHRPRNVTLYDPEKVTQLMEKISIKTENDLPVDMPDPYVEPPKRCLLCQHNVKLSYKNPQLLSQFVSPYTGRLYGRHITGLCLHMQRRVSREIGISRRCGFMPVTYKTSKFLTNEMLFNPFQKKSYPPGQ